MIGRKTTFGIIVGTRGFFNADLAKKGRQLLLARLEKMGFDAVILPEKATPTGANETVADAAKCARLFSDRRDAIDGIIVALPNFGDELGVVNAINDAKLNVPVMVQASDDDPKKVSVADRRDSFCGKLSVCNNLYQYGIPWTDTAFHTCDIAGREFAADIESFARTCRVVRGLRNARIGSVGARPTAFQTMRVSEKLLQASGITVITCDLSEIIFAAQKIDDGAKALKRKLEEIDGYGKIPATINRQNVIKQAKFGLALEAWMKKNAVVAAGVQCWTSIQENYGCAACLSMSMLGDRLIPCACEVDVAGVISMYALSLASGNPSALLDWNNNYGGDRDKCVNTHCSNFPKSFVGGPVEISNLDVLGTTLGQENCFGAIKGKVAKGPMTYFRITTDDRCGGIRAYLGEGDFTDDPFPMDGGIAVCKIDQLQKLMKFICKNGFEHHVGMVRGTWAREVFEAATTYLGWDVYWHGND